MAAGGLTPLEILEAWLAAHGNLAGGQVARFLNRAEIVELQQMSREAALAAIAAEAKLIDAVQIGRRLDSVSHPIANTGFMTDFETEALAHLQALTGQGDVEFRPGQLESVRALVEDKRRVLVVERTGWGKSAVYFIATRMLRDRGYGVTMLISPLIALMENQTQAAARMGLRSDKVNSTNRDAWDHIKDQLSANELDLLLVSEQRLSNPSFRSEWLPEIGSRVGLVVVDEVHCISDWGHDFRPHYRRIGRFLQRLGSGVPVIGCTATANDRVVTDVESQLGDDILTIRGGLAREGLRLEVHTDKRRPDARLAWLVRNVPDLPGSGIIYCLTRRDVEIVAEFLEDHGIRCGTYVGGGSEPEVVAKEATLEAFVVNELKCVVATSALGMGYDKPDVGFVIHYQMPQSAISYYQQVGRAGRSLAESYGILLAGTEDRDIQDWFITNAFPDEAEVAAILRELEDAEEGLRAGQLAARTNIGTHRLEGLLVQLEVEGVIERVESSWVRTLAPWKYPRERVDQVNAWRREEQAAMEQYITLRECRMQFLRTQLDDHTEGHCGICDICRGERFGSEPELEIIGEADAILRHHYVKIEPRKRWAAGADNGARAIPAELRAETGWCLTDWGVSGWGPLVKQNKQIDGEFADELVDAVAEMVRSQLADQPRWVTWVPSERHPELVPSFGRRLAAALGVPGINVLRKTRPTAPQKSMNNSATQLGNVHGAFELDAGALSLEGTGLLVDDVIDSRWTTTELAAVLRSAGSGPVVPIGLAYAGQSS